MINYYQEKEIKAEDFRDLSDMERKMVVQRFIDQIIYNSSRFKAAMKVLEDWEKKSKNKNNS